jgi:phage gp36-like protein
MFIEEEDLGKSIYSEVLGAIARENPNHNNENIALAIDEADSYLNTRYNTETLWAQTAADRNALIKNAVIDIALYHIHAVLEEVPVIRRERYDYAKTTLKDIRKGEIVLHDIPKLSVSEPENTEIKYGGISKRY